MDLRRSQVAFIGHVIDPGRLIDGLACTGRCPAQSFNGALGGGARAPTALPLRTPDPADGVSRRHAAYVPTRCPVFRCNIEAGLALLAPDRNTGPVVAGNQPLYS